MFGTLKEVLANKAQEAVLTGDCLEELDKVPDGIAHCVITSPPFFGLRDYQTGKWEGGDSECDHRSGSRHQNQGKTSRRNGRANVEEQRNEIFSDVCKKCGARRVGDKQIGLEKVHDCGVRLLSKSLRASLKAEPCGECFVCKIVAVSEKVRRVLRDDGVYWLNLGDSFTGGGSSNYGNNSGLDTYVWEHRGVASNGPKNPERTKKSSLPDLGLGQKNLVGVPFRVALSLQAEGWILRAAIPWCKRDPMPDSANDRPGRATEYVFQLVKSREYYFDMDAVRKKPKMEKSEVAYELDKKQLREGATWTGKDKPRSVNPEGRNFRDADLWYGSLSPDDTPWGIVGSNDEILGLDVTIEPKKEKHFAAYPTRLVKPLLLAATSQKGCCPKCGAPWKRKVEKTRVSTRPGKETKTKDGGGRLDSGVTGNRDPERHVTRRETKGWGPSCECDAGAPVPCIVLDPFAGVGTTMLVANRHGRRSVGIELNPENVERLKRFVNFRGKNSAEMDESDKGGFRPNFGGD